MQRIPLIVLLAAALAGLAVMAGWPPGRDAAGAAASARPLTAPDQPPWRVSDDVAGRPDGEHLLVRFRAAAGAEERAAVHRENDGQVEARLRPERVEVVQIAPTDSVREALARYRDDPEVLYAEPNRRVSIAATPNDYFFKSPIGEPDLWGLDNTGQGGGRPDADVDAPEAWDRLGLGGAPWPTADFAVGVIDTGVYAGHEDLAGKAIADCRTATPVGTLIAGCEDDNGHGTHVAGTVAAVGNNGRGVVGVAPNARIYACKALDATGAGTDASIIACLNDIVAKRGTHNIRVISMSFGSDQPAAAEESAIDHAWDSGLLPVAAAGNEGTSGINYPAGYANAVSVGATDGSDARAPFSNFNADVEISAPGVDIVSTHADPPVPSPNAYAVADGTSMATPHVAAVAALIAAQSGGTAQALRSALAAAVDDLGPPGRDPSFGFGRANACLALGGACSYATPRAPTGLTATPGDARVALDWGDAPEPYPVDYLVFRRNPDGSWPAAPIATTSDSAFTDAGLANGTSYAYRVTARNRAIPANESAPSIEATATPVRPPIVADHVPAGYRILAGRADRRTRRLSRLFRNDGRRVEITARGRGRRHTADLYAHATIAAAQLASLRRLEIAWNGSQTSRAALLRLRAFNWRTGRWDAVARPRRRVTRDRTIRWTSPSPRDYVSASGQVRLRITGTASRSFRARTDWVRFQVEY